MLPSLYALVNSEEAQLQWCLIRLRKTEENGYGSREISWHHTKHEALISSFDDAFVNINNDKSWKSLQLIFCHY